MFSKCKRAASRHWRWCVLGSCLALLWGVVALGVFLAFLPIFDLATQKPEVQAVVAATFERLPDDDDAIQRWLLTRPGVYEFNVERSGKTVTVIWVRRDRHNGPVTPDLREVFDAFGYEGMSNYQESRYVADK